MSDTHLFPDHSYDEIEAIFDAYAERGFEDLPSDLFFSMMETAGSEEPKQYVKIESELVDDELVLHPPTGISLPFTVLGNEIILGSYRIGLQWLGIRESKTPVKA